MIKADKKAILNKASDFYQIYWSGDTKWIRVCEYYYDEGEDDGNGSSRCVEYSDFELPLYDFIEKNYDEDWYSDYTSNLKQFYFDLTPEQALEQMDKVFEGDILPLQYEALTMETKVGFYVNI